MELLTGLIAFVFSTLALTFIIEKVLSKDEPSDIFSAGVAFVISFILNLITFALIDFSVIGRGILSFV